MQGGVGGKTCLTPLVEQHIYDEFLTPLFDIHFYKENTISRFIIMIYYYSINYYYNFLITKKWTNVLKLCATACRLACNTRVIDIKTKAPVIQMYLM